MDDVIKQIKIAEIIKSDAAVSADDGNLIYEEIEKIIAKKGIVELDFTGIQILITAFLNAAIGRLYSKYTSEQLNKLLKLKNVAEEDKILFKKVVDRAKEYFADKKTFEDSANNAFYGN